MIINDYILKSENNLYERLYTKETTSKAAVIDFNWNELALVLLDVYVSYSSTGIISVIYTIKR